MKQDTESNIEKGNLNPDNIITKIINDTSVKYLEILDENPDRCFVTILGEIHNESKSKKENFIIKIKKKEFDADDLNSFGEKVRSILTLPEQKFNNDIYYKFVSMDMVENRCKSDLIYPADDKVIDKYRRKQFSLFEETPEIYREKTLKYIKSIGINNVKWIHNILYNNSEKIIYKVENALLITQDYNTKDNEKLLNCLGIPYNDTILSLRDLNATHLELLEIFLNSRNHLAEIYNLDRNKIRCFVHYPPSFYYFHVHYLNVDYESNSTSINRAIDLYTIINNIKLKNDYYQTTNLEILLQKDSKLYEALHE